MRRLNNVILLSAVCFVELFLAYDLQAQEKQKNVVLIVADDLGLQAGCFGDKVIKTPNIDRLAVGSTWFTRAHCTTASCSASRSVLLTGLYNHATGHYGHSHGEHHFSTYESVVTLPIMLAEAGYRTCSIGKTHVAPEYVYHFEAYRNEGTQGHRNTVRMAQNAKEWIAENDKRPFFLYFCPTDPHRGAGPGHFANHNDQPEFYPGVTEVRYAPEDMVVPPWLPDKPEVRAELAEYYQAISRMDQGIGVLLDTLDQTGHADDTLVIFLSDNGPPFPGAKTTLYEPGAKLPLLVRQPGQKSPGGTCNALVNWADIMPTVLDYCSVEPKAASKVVALENVGQRKTSGQPRPYKLHGRSFLSIIGEEQPEGWNESFASHTFHEVTMYYPMRAMYLGQYKYIVNFAHDLPYPFASDLQKSPTWESVLRDKDDKYGKRTVHDYLHRPRYEMYDLNKDPGELKNLAYDRQHREITLDMQKRLKAWQEATGDPWVLKWEYE